MIYDMDYWWNAIFHGVRHFRINGIPLTKEDRLDFMSMYLMGGEL